LKDLLRIIKLISGLAFLVLLLFSCRTTKFVPQDQYLLNKVKVEVDTKNIDRQELKNYFRQTPNTSILGFWKFHLALYNLSSRKKNDGWLKRIGEAPVIYDPFLTRRSDEELKRYMHNKGYYDAEVTDTVYRKKKKAEVVYRITANEPYTISRYKVDVLDDSLQTIVHQDSTLSTVHVGENLDMDKLASERLRMVRTLKDQGYYRMNRNSISYEADTTLGKRQSAVTMLVGEQEIQDSLGNIEYQPHTKFTFRNFYFLTEYEPRKALFGEHLNMDMVPQDTLKVDNYYFIYKKSLRFRPDLLINANHIGDAGYYKVSEVERTYNELSLLRLFKVINIQFEDTGQRDSLGHSMLDCIIQLTPSTKQSYSFSLEGTNSSGNLGVAGNLNYQHRNLFKGGEILDVQLRGATERQSYGVKDSVKFFNTLETGIETKLTLPKFLAPIRSNRLFQYSTPKTLFSLAYNYQRRPDYTRTIARASFGYQWKSSEYSTHRINLLDFNLVKMFSYDPEFIASIENLYIRSSYTDHSISSFNYIYTYNTQRLQKRTNYKYLRASFETAGNTLYGYSKLANRPQELTDTLAGGQYKFLGTPFAQYVRTDLEYRRGWVLDKYNTVVIRGFGGIAVPYGNSKQVPFERKYFTGGANDIRAWPVRSLGPGTYKADPNAFPNQTGDVKLEGNIEYRYKMIGMLEGAFFLDVGNIWSLNDNRPGTEFRLDKFYNELAVGTGTGFRFDFSYVIFRLDVGMKLCDPSRPAGSRWIIGNRPYTTDDFNVTFAIGYPF